MVIREARYFLSMDWLGRIWLVPENKRDDWRQNWRSYFEYAPPWAQAVALDRLTFTNPHT